MTNFEPITPAAPGRFSTKKLCPSRSESFCAISRAITSTPPPAATGTTTRTGRSGYSACAAADASIIAAAAGIRTRRIADSLDGRGDAPALVAALGTPRAFVAARRELAVLDQHLALVGHRRPDLMLVAVLEHDHVDLEALCALDVFLLPVGDLVVGQQDRARDDVHIVGFRPVRRVVIGAAHTPVRHPDQDHLEI